MTEPVMKAGGHAPSTRTFSRYEVAIPLRPDFRFMHEPVREDLSDRKKPTSAVSNLFNAGDRGGAGGQRGGSAAQRNPKSPSR